MIPIFVDSNVILDVFEDDSQWGEWSFQTLTDYSSTHSFYINPIIYSEISIGFERIEELERAIQGCGYQMLQIPKEALFLAGKTFLRHRKNRGNKINILPDFFIGAHAAVMGWGLITRDIDRYKTYFPTVNLVMP